MIGDLLRDARNKAKLTQEDLAARAGVSRNYISLLELNQRNPTVEVLLNISDALGVKASNIVALIEQNRPSQHRRHR